VSPERVGPILFALVTAVQVPRIEYKLAPLHGAMFVERLQSVATTQSGAAERRRVIDRTAQFGIVVRRDTAIVTADSIAVVETADGMSRRVNVDAVIGGRWALKIDSTGRPAAVDWPFVPQDIADVDDVGTAMDDFFPLPPPVSPVGRSVTVAGVKWLRLSDSAGHSRFRWSANRDVSTTTVGDSVPVRSTGKAIEDGELVWDPGRGPLGWKRHIETDMTSRFAGRTVHALVDQRSTVRRLP